MEEYVTRIGDVTIQRVIPGGAGPTVEPVRVMESEELLRAVKEEPLDEEEEEEEEEGEEVEGDESREEDQHLLLEGTEEGEGEVEEEQIIVKEEPQDEEEMEKEAENTENRQSDSDKEEKDGEEKEEDEDGDSGKRKADGEDDSENKAKKKKMEAEMEADKKKISNLRKNIREVMDEAQLDEATLAAQRQEAERLKRVQDQQKYLREVQRQIQLNKQNSRTQSRVISLLQGGSTSLLKTSAVGSTSSSSSSNSSTSAPSTVLVKLGSGQQQALNRKTLEVLRGGKTVTTTEAAKPGIARVTPGNRPAMVTPSVSIAPVKPIITEGQKKDSCDTDVVTISSSSDSEDDCILISEGEEEEEEEDVDTTNSGMHTNDLYNIPDEQGRVLINVGKPESEPEIYLAPQIARIIKPHQIGGVRFLFDNVVESIERFNNSTGFGCILAHSMGLGKTLQVVSFCDVFLRETTAKTVMCIMPINTLQNWMAEFNLWLPTDPSASPLAVHGEVRPRHFGIFVLNDMHKTIAARAKVVEEWNREGGVLLIGYEMYRQLSLKRPGRLRKGKKRLPEEDVDDEKNKPLLEAMHEALVRPGPDLVICDEGHRIKNSHASISHALKQIRTKRRVVLTGYPLQNNLLEYWCMVDFVRPNYLGTKTEFSNMFERPIQNGQCIDSTPQDIKLMRYRAHVLHSLLEGFVQRRSHSVLRNTLPQKEEYVILVRMTTLQRKLYDTFMNEVVRTKAVPNPLKAFAVCCKIWNHPDILYNFIKKKELDELQDLDIEETANLHTGPNSPRRPLAPKEKKGKSVKKAQIATVKPEVATQPQPPAVTPEVKADDKKFDFPPQSSGGGPGYGDYYPPPPYPDMSYPYQRPPPPGMYYPSGYYQDNAGYYPGYDSNYPGYFSNYGPYPSGTKNEEFDKQPHPWENSFTGNKEKNLSKSPKDFDSLKPGYQEFYPVKEEKPEIKDEKQFLSSFSGGQVSYNYRGYGSYSDYSYPSQENPHGWNKGAFPNFPQNDTPGSGNQEKPKPAVSSESNVSIGGDQKHAFNYLNEPNHALKTDSEVDRSHGHSAPNQNVLHERNHSNQNLNETHSMLSNSDQQQRLQTNQETTGSNQNVVNTQENLHKNRMTERMTDNQYQRPNPEVTSSGFQANNSQGIFMNQRNDMDPSSVSSRNQVDLMGNRNSQETENYSHGYHSNNLLQNNQQSPHNSIRNQYNLFGNQSTQESDFRALQEHLSSGQTAYSGMQSSKDYNQASSNSRQNLPENSRTQADQEQNFIRQSGSFGVQRPEHMNHGERISNIQNVQDHQEGMGGGQSVFGSQELQKSPRTSQPGHDSQRRLPSGQDQLSSNHQNMFGRSEHSMQTNQEYISSPQPNMFGNSRIDGNLPVGQENLCNKLHNMYGDERNPQCPPEHFDSTIQNMYNTQQRTDPMQNKSDHMTSMQQNVYNKQRPDHSMSRGSEHMSSQQKMFGNQRSELNTQGNIENLSGPQQNTFENQRTEHGMQISQDRMSFSQQNLVGSRPDSQSRVNIRHESAGSNNQPVYSGRNDVGSNTNKDQLQRSPGGAQEKDTHHKAIVNQNLLPRNDQMFSNSMNQSMISQGIEQNVYNNLEQNCPPSMARYQENINQDHFRGGQNRFDRRDSLQGSQQAIYLEQNIQGSHRKAQSQHQPAYGNQPMDHGALGSQDLCGNHPKNSQSQIQAGKRSLINHEFSSNQQNEPYGIRTNNEHSMQKIMKSDRQQVDNEQKVHSVSEYSSNQFNMFANPEIRGEQQFHSNQENNQGSCTDVGDKDSSHRMHMNMDNLLENQPQSHRDQKHSNPRLFSSQNISESHTWLHNTQDHQRSQPNFFDNRGTHNREATYQINQLNQNMHGNKAASENQQAFQTSQDQNPHSQHNAYLAQGKQTSGVQKVENVIGKHQNVQDNQYQMKPSQDHIQEHQQNVIERQHNLQINQDSMHGTAQNIMSQKNQGEHQMIPRTSSNAGVYGNQSQHNLQGSQEYVHNNQIVGGSVSNPVNVSVSMQMGHQRSGLNINQNACMPESHQHGKGNSNIPGPQNFNLPNSSQLASAHEHYQDMYSTQKTIFSNQNLSRSQHNVMGTPEVQPGSSKDNLCNNQHGTYTNQFHVPSSQTSNPGPQHMHGPSQNNSASSNPQMVGNQPSLQGNHGTLGNQSHFQNNQSQLNSGPSSIPTMMQNKDMPQGTPSQPHSNFQNFGGNHAQFISPQNVPVSSHNMHTEHFNLQNQHNIINSKGKPDQQKILGSPQSQSHQHKTQTPQSHSVNQQGTQTGPEHLPHFSSSQHRVQNMIGPSGNPSNQRPMNSFDHAIIMSSKGMSGGQVIHNQQQNLGMQNTQISSDEQNRFKGQFDDQFSSMGNYSKSGLFGQDFQFPYQSHLGEQPGPSGQAFQKEDDKGEEGKSKEMDKCRQEGGESGKNMSTASTNTEKEEDKRDRKDEDDKIEKKEGSKASKEDPGIPYDWANEYLKGYIPGDINSSAKMAVFFCILEESIALGDRILVFSQSLFTLNLMEELLQQQLVPGKEDERWARNANYYRLDGSTTAMEREKLINEFNSNCNLHLFLVSTRAGSLGINLVGANRVIVFDASWNPCHDTQAVCRVYRYGQKKPCFVYRLVTDNCLEKKIYDRQINKQGMSDRVVDECNPDAHLSIKEVTSLCWDDKVDDESPKDFSSLQDSYIDVVLQKVIQKHSNLLSKEPFQHESLLVDRKEKKLSQAEKRMAKRGYEMEKQAITRPVYNGVPPNQVRPKPMASVRPMQAEMGQQRQRGWIPASVWQRQGMSAQEMTLPLDVVIPTNAADRASIVLKAGQKVMVLKSPKGIYMQLENGKIIAIRTAFKVGANKKPGDQQGKGEMARRGGRQQMMSSRGRPVRAVGPVSRPPPVTVTVTRKRPQEDDPPAPARRDENSTSAHPPTVSVSPMEVTVTEKDAPNPFTAAAAASLSSMQLPQSPLPQQTNQSSTQSLQQSQQTQEQQLQLSVKNTQHSQQTSSHPLQPLQPTEYAQQQSQGQQQPLSHSQSPQLSMPQASSLQQPLPQSHSQVQPSLQSIPQLPPISHSQTLVQTISQPQIQVQAVSQSQPSQQHSSQISQSQSLQQPEPQIQSKQPSLPPQTVPKTQSSQQPTSASHFSQQSISSQQFPLQPMQQSQISHQSIPLTTNLPQPIAHTQHLHQPIPPSQIKHPNLTQNPVSHSLSHQLPMPPSPIIPTPQHPHQPISHSQLTHQHLTPHMPHLSQQQMQLNIPHQMSSPHTIPPHPQVQMRSTHSLPHPQFPLHSMPHPQMQSHSMPPQTQLLQPVLPHSQSVPPHPQLPPLPPISHMQLPQQPLPQQQHPQSSILHPQHPQHYDPPPIPPLVGDQLT